MAVLKSTDAKVINDRKHRQEDDQTQCTEPVRLPVRRGNGEIESVPHLVPHAAVVAGHYVKTVRPGAEIRVSSLPSRPRILPLFVLTFEPITKAHAFGY